MNILVDALPETVEIGGRVYQLSTDFRPCLKTIIACEDSELTGHEKALVILTNLFPEIPDNLEAAMEKAQWFLDGGDAQQERTDERQQPRVYSFSKDSSFIFAAFRQTHGIDLQTVQMHWWVFIALFMDIGQDTTFSQLTALRKRIKTGKANKYEREAARELGDIFEIANTETRDLSELEAEDEFMRAWKSHLEQQESQCPQDTTVQ
ncbi:MAG: hypothetical protein HY865_22195 [Chloroflexi bacterium]|nr:hypothetical protein [Chloroflexota bacterium]